MSKSIRNKIMSRWLPPAILDPMIRRKAKYKDSLLNDVEVSLAHTCSDYEHAFHLVYDAYVKRGWLVSREFGNYVTSRHALPESSVLLLRYRGSIVGTVALMEDSPLWLPIDATFPSYVAELRGPQSKLVEVGVFAFAPAFRSTGFALCLMVAVFRYALERLHASYLLVSVEKDIRPYYRALLGFRRFTPVRSYRGFNIGERKLEDDPVVGMLVEVDSMREWATKHYRAPPSGFMNLLSLGFEGFPARYEKYPPQNLSAQDLARYKLSGTTFQELYCSGNLPSGTIDLQTISHLKRRRAATLGPLLKKID